jgi:hypothetical protein
VSCKMSLILVKPFVIFLLGLFCLVFYAERCHAQTASLGNTNGIKDSIKPGNDSLKKEATSVWSRFKKNAAATVKANTTNERKDIATVSNDVTTLKNRSSRKKIKKNIQDTKAENSLTPVTDAEPSDSLKKASRAVKEKAAQKKESFSKTVSDTLNKDSLKKQVSNTFSKEKIENTLKNKTSIDDYKISGDDLKRKTGFAGKANRKNVAKNKIQNLSGKLGVDKVTDPLKNGVDSAKHIDIKEILKKQLTNNVKGSISVGYEYGILPYASAESYPASGFKSEGRVSVLLLTLPVEVTYRYSTVKSVIGINNYFRISYDANRYKDELEKKMAIKDKLKKIQLDKLQLDKQDMAMKMEYMKVMSDLKLPEFKLPDTSVSINKNVLNGLSDSLKLDSTKVLSYLKSKNEYSAKKDSILKFTYECKAKYEEYKKMYDSLSGAIDKLSNLSGDIKDYKNSDVKKKAGENSNVSKFQEKLKNIKKFEIGLCTPSYSLFLLSNAPLKGINMEYAGKEHFFAITYGTTMNTILYNPNTLQGKIQGARNFYNFFDFNNLSSGRKVLAVKGGRGQKEGTHLFAGILLGKGKMDYLTITDPKYGKKESNVIVEIDGKYKFSEVLSAEVIAGKSSVQTEDLSLQAIKTSFGEIFSYYRSNAIQAKLNYEIKKTKTKMQVSGRLVDPYFKSFGVTFLRSDNIRYELKADQVITRNIKYSMAYRNEEDNLLGLMNYKNTFQTVTNTLSIKLKKGISLRLNYSPLLRTLRNNNEVIKDHNSIATAILSYVPKLKDTQANFNLLCSRYKITSDSGDIDFNNFTYTHQFQFKNGFKTGLNASWFENTLKDTLNNDTYLGLVDIGYTTKDNNSFTLGGKIAYKPGIPTEFGFIAKATFKIYKTLFWEAEAEKILTGDYYNLLIDAKIKRFPYYISNKLIMNF